MSKKHKAKGSDYIATITSNYTLDDSVVVDIENILTEVGAEECFFDEIEDNDNSYYGVITVETDFELSEETMQKIIKAADLGEMGSVEFGNVGDFESLDFEAYAQEKTVELKSKGVK